MVRGYRSESDMFLFTMTVPSTDKTVNIFETRPMRPMMNIPFTVVSLNS